MSETLGKNPSQRPELDARFRVKLGKDAGVKLG